MAADSCSRSEPSAAANSVTSQQPPADTTSKQAEEDEGSSWRELDSSWSKSTFKQSSRCAVELREFGAGDIGKESWMPPQTTAVDASVVGGILVLVERHHRQLLVQNQLSQWQQ
ncbi:hypothetical protein HPB50_012639 [Hyalomma asiaticum]|uniref:Uncharacterized protein n=1 Tax=Hyalomma asiaticum TaxID=266040 RepID=A0ACB7THI6_HYAAI|nr:hypothetical protein HPB50_012639 [Hyalomma asiaticum]